MLYNFAADSFYIVKLCSRLFVLHCRSRPKYDTSMHFDPHFESRLKLAAPAVLSVDAGLLVHKVIMFLNYS